MSLLSDYEERKDEIKDYIELLEQMDNLLKKGLPLLTDGESNEYKISAGQQKILFSSLYLQLYNIIEATVSKCLSRLEYELKSLSFGDLQGITSHIKKEWIRRLTKSHANSNIETRAKAIISLVEDLLNPRQTLSIEFDRGGGGNWDDEDIHKLTQRIGMPFVVPDYLREAVKKTLYDDMRQLELVKYTRNKLAHGELSFVECGERLGIFELKELATTVFAYLEALIAHFDDFIENRKFYTVPIAAV